MATLSQVNIFDTEFLWGTIEEKAVEVLGFMPFPWQIEAAWWILQGCDVILDVAGGGEATMQGTLFRTSRCVVLGQTLVSGLGKRGLNFT